MSKRIELRVTPLSRPDLFEVIQPRDVKLGDIFQGTKGRRAREKWYQNTTGQACVESHRTYYRPKATAASALGITMPRFGERLDGSIKEPKPGDHAPVEQEEREVAGETAMEAAAGDTVPILTMTWSINLPGLKRLIDEVEKLDIG